MITPLKYHVFENIIENGAYAPFRHETFQIFGRFQIFSFQIIMSKVVGFDLKVTKTQFWTWGVRGFRLVMAYFRFFHAELSLMPVLWSKCSICHVVKSVEFFLNLFNVV